MQSLELGAGFERWVIDVSNYLVEKGYEVVIITWGFAEVKRLSEEDIRKELKATWIKVGTSLGDVIRPRYSLIARQYIRKARTVYVPNLLRHYVLYQVLPWVKLYRPKLIMGIHNPIDEDSFWYKLSLLLAKLCKAKIHVINSEDYVKYRLRGFEVYYVPNGVHIEKFPIEKIGFRQNRFVVLFVGRLHEDKGIDIVLCVAKLLWEKGYRDIEFRIVGTGRYFHLVAKYSKIVKNIVVLGYVPFEQLVEEYGRAHLLILPSRREPYGFVVAEAQVMGLPCICSNNPGPRDIVINDVTGYITKVNEPQAYASIIVKLYDLWREDPNQYYEWKRKIAYIQRKRLDWCKYLRKFEEMLETDYA